MKRQHTVLVLIAVPAVVSLIVTSVVLFFWDRQQEPDYVMLPTHSGTALIPPRETQPGSSDSGGSSGSTGAGVDEGSDGMAIPPGCENPIHEVSPDQTLGIIAEAYGIPIEDIIAINSMVDPAFDPDFLSIGQQIIIPECGVPSPTPSPEPTITQVPTRNVPTPAPTATEPPPGLIVVEVARVLNPGDVTSEAVEVINLGTSVARLGGWSLRNDQGDVFTFPALNLFPQGAVTVYTGGGEDTAIDIYWGRDRAAWQPGGVVLLYNADGDLVYEYTVPGG
jgi:LysM repeat protein